VRLITEREKDKIESIAREARRLRKFDAEYDDDKDDDKYYRYASHIFTCHAGTISHLTEVFDAVRVELLVANAFSALYECFSGSIFGGVYLTQVHLLLFIRHYILFVQNIRSGQTQANPRKGVGLGTRRHRG
jgi:hypothetical protein